MVPAGSQQPEKIRVLFSEGSVYALTQRPSYVAVSPKPKYMDLGIKEWEWEWLLSSLCPITGRIFPDFPGDFELC